MLFRSVFLISVVIVIAKNRHSEKCGVKASENHFPWLVIIEHEYNEQPRTRIHCTGALVSSRHVVTSGTCFDRDSFSGLAKSVRLGHFNTIRKEGHRYNTDFTNGTLKVPIETVTIDPDYSSPNWEVPNRLHDVALITLKDVVPYNDYIRPICLPSVDIMNRDPAESQLYFAGISDKDRDKYETKQAALTYMDTDVCKNSMSNYGIPVVEDNFCATLKEDEDPCLINSFVNGGVLMNKIQDRYELAGLGIFEGSCTIKSVERIRGFTNMFLYLNWVRSKTIEWTCGKQGAEDRFAWLAVIEFKYKNEPAQAQCAGALISRRHVVTTADCFHDKIVQGMVRTVRLGLHNTVDGRNCTRHTRNKNCTDDSAVRIPIKAVITHPEYTRSFKESGIHDIALAILSELVTYTDVIRPICLPSDDVTQLAETDRDLYANEFYYKGPLSEIKRRSAMTFVDKEGCRELLDNYGMILPGDLTCATQTEVTDPNWCLYPGDLLVNKREDRFELVGLVQFSYCGTTKVFNNVYRSLDWIRSVIPEWTHGCGRRKVEHVELILNGESSKAGDWPWHVAIYKIRKTMYSYICGGTLISERMVLTAAHCVIERGIPVNPEILKIILGKYNLNDIDLQSQERYVESIMVHEAFAPTHLLNNDIALLRLAVEASYNDYVQPACLWSDDVFENLPQRDLGTVIGWGYDESNTVSPRLKYANMPMVPELTCIEKNPTFYVKVLDNKKKFCAGWANGTSPCNGDSGGGFFTFVPDSPGADDSNVRGSWYVRGIVSLTPSLRNVARCDPNQYVVFTDVNNYTEWIQTHFIN